MLIMVQTFCFKKRKKKFSIFAFFYIVNVCIFMFKLDQFFYVADSM